jgi:bifunctional non-homologous end joining protein LigD
LGACLNSSFCLPTVGKAVPAGPEWFHEIKSDGYRLRIERDGDRVRLITRGGSIDGEAVIPGVDGIADFNALHSGKQNGEVQLCAFDVLAMDGDDLRNLPLSMRKVHLDRLLLR